VPGVQRQPADGQFPDHETIAVDTGHGPGRAGGSRLLRPRLRPGRYPELRDAGVDPDSGQTWGITPLTRKGFDGDAFQACLAFVEPPDCGSFFLGDYIAVASTDSAAQVLWTGNGPHAMDVFSQRVAF
jgi:hypothetical protein